MRTLPILLCALAVAAECGDIFAQDPPGLVSAGPTALPNAKTVERIDFFSSSREETLSKNALKNADGTSTIGADRQSTEANILNQKICASFGANDVTNETDVTLGPGTAHAGVCIGPISHQFSSSNKPAQKLPSSISLQAPEQKIDVPCFSVSAGYTENGDRQSASYASCNASAGNYSACFGKGCRPFQDWPGDR